LGSGRILRNHKEIPSIDSQHCAIKARCALLGIDFIKLFEVLLNSSYSLH
jgi:hypothetical protein